MGHHIRGVVAMFPDAPVITAALDVSTVGPLGGGCVLVPLTDHAFDALPDVPGDALAGFEWLTPKVESALSRARAVLSFAWVETEYFGGVGTQAAALYHRGRREWAAAAPGDVINRALDALGVRPGPRARRLRHRSLGRFRSMDQFEPGEAPASR